MKRWRWVLVAGLLVGAVLVTAWLGQGRNGEKRLESADAASAADRGRSRSGRRLFGGGARSKDAGASDGERSSDGDAAELFAQGRVIDKASGQPVAGATIDVLARDDADPEASVTTGSDGRFRVPVPSRWMLAYVRASGYAFQRERLVAGEDATIELERGVRVEGGVTSSRGPVAGVRVLCHPDHFTWDADATTSDREGAFVLTGCLAGRIKLTTRSEDWARTELTLPREYANGEVASGVTIELVRGQRVIGEARYPAGSAVVGGTVIASRPDLDWTTLIHAPRVSTSDRGAFDLGVLAPGDWFVVVIAPDGETAHSRVTLEVADEPETLVLTVPEGMEITGRVVAEGEPVAGADLSIVRDTRKVDESAEPGVVIRERALGSSGSGNYRRRTTADEMGRFRFHGLERGEHVIDVTTEERPPKFFDGIEAGARDITLELPALTRLEARLVDAAGSLVEVGGNGFVNRFDPDTGKPLGRAWAELEDGRLSQVIEPGTYELLVTAEDHPLAMTAPFEAKDGATTELTVPLPDGVTYEGRVVGPDGQPIPGVRVEEPIPSWTVAAGLWRYSGESERRSDAHGDFEALGQPGGRLLVYHPEYESRLITLPEEPKTGRHDLGAIRLSPGEGHPSYREYDIAELKAQWER